MNRKLKEARKLSYEDGERVAKYCKQEFFDAVNEALENEGYENPGAENYEEIYDLMVEGIGQFIEDDDEGFTSLKLCAECYLKCLDNYDTNFDVAVECLKEILDEGIDVDIDDDIIDTSKHDVDYTPEIVSMKNAIKAYLERHNPNVKIKKWSYSDGLASWNFDLKGTDEDLENIDKDGIRTYIAEETDYNPKDLEILVYSTFIDITFKQKMSFSESKLQVLENVKVSKKLKEDVQNLYFVGYCCCAKDKDLYSEPCFLGLGPDNTFRPIGWSYEDIYFGSKVEVGEAKEPSYMKPEDFHMTLNRLWVEIHTEDPRYDPNTYPADDICRALESIFPDFKFYATMYPVQDMEKYYSYISTDVPAEMKKAYEDLQNKLWKRRDTARTTWEFPF